ncbi:MAG: filamentous hemagglutinin N-terminal domain-containing protein [Parachlamydiales bacterium]|jgi:filamentous hemagglutinin family protein
MPLKKLSYFWWMRVFQLFFCPLVVLANPQNAQVENGAVSFFSNGQALLVEQKTDKAVINWEKFSVLAGEKTEFLLPSEKAATLNRVTGGEISEIYGELKSNGLLFLINPQGLVIGPGGVVDTEGFLASTLDLKSTEFLQGRELNFTGVLEKDIVNRGLVIARSSDLILIAKEIDNPGQLQAEKGQIKLKSGFEVTLFPEENNRMAVRLKKAGSMKNSGLIRAVSLEIESAGGMAECLAVSAEGLIEAVGVGKQAGRLVLLTDEVLSVKGELRSRTVLTEGGEAKSVGGDIRLLGNEIRLEAGSLIEASGDLGGGSVLIGGGYQGKNPEIKNASSVYMDREARVLADGRENGAGGKVIFWANRKLDMRGQAFARGGVNGGDGGFVEVSSHQDWAFTGYVNTTALKGKTGKLLLDPYDLIISFDPDSQITKVPPLEPYSQGYASGNSAKLNVTNLVVSLAFNNVQVDTVTDLSGSQSGDITVNAAISENTGHDLTIKAYRNLTVNANIDIGKEGLGDLYLYFNQGGGGGTLTFASDVVVSGQGGSEYVYAIGKASSASALVCSHTTEQTTILLAPDTGVTYYSVGPAYDMYLAFSDVQSVTSNSNAGNVLDLSYMTYAEVTLSGAGAGSVRELVAPASWLDSFANIQVLQAPASGSDILIGPDGGAVFNLTGVDTGNIGSGILSSYVNFANLKGGAGNDLFVFGAGGSLSGILDGGAGSNTVDFTSASGAYLVLTATDAGWEYNGLIGNGWRNLQNIIGSSGGGLYLAVYPAGALSGTLTCSGANNWVDYYTGSSVAVSLADSSASGIYSGAAGGFSGVNIFSAALLPEDTIYGPNGNTNITLRGGGTVVFELSPYPVWGYFFSQVSGGSGNDTFTLSSSFGSVAFRSLLVDGGAGSNTLDFSFWPASSWRGWRVPSAGIGGIPGAGLAFKNIQIILEDGRIIWTDPTVITSLLTQPEVQLIAQEQNCGRFLMEKVVDLKPEGRFIIRNRLLPKVEIDLARLKTENLKTSLFLETSAKSGGAKKPKAKKQHVAQGDPSSATSIITQPEPEAREKDELKGLGRMGKIIERKKGAGKSKERLSPDEIDLSRAPKAEEENFDFEP